MKKQGKTKKLLAFLLSLTVLFTMSAPAVWADSSGSGNDITGKDDKVNLSIKSGNTTVSAFVRDDYSAYLQIPKNAEVNAGNAEIELTMKNIESLGMGGITKSHKITINTGIDGKENVRLENHIKPITDFQKATISGKIGEKEYSYVVETVTRENDYLVKATTNEDLTRAAWKELASHVATTTYDKDDSYMVIPANAYMQIGQERLSFTNKKGESLKLDNVGDLKTLETSIREAVELDTNATLLKDGKDAEAYIPAGTILRVGATEAKLLQGATIDMSGLNNLQSGSLEMLRNASTNEDMIVALLNFVMNPITAASGQQDIKCNVTFDEQVAVDKDENKTTINAKTDQGTLDDTTVDTITNLLETAGEKETVEIVVPQDENGTAPEISKEIIEAAKNSKSETLVIKTKDKDDNIAATFEFKTTEIKDGTITAVNPGIKAAVADASQKLAAEALPTGAKTMGITLAHNGKFPAPATITIGVDQDKFKPGDAVYLYYINSDTKKLEMVGDKALTVSEDYTVTFTLDHASEYVLSSATVKTAVDVTGITLNTTKTSVKTGKTVALKATVTPADATDKTVTWTSSNTKIATVDANGVVTGKAVGSATITAKTANGKTAACAVSVSLSAPENVKAASASNTSVKVSWKKAVGAQKYQVYRATSKKGKFKKVATTSGASYTNKKLTTGKTYYYKVKAISGSATSAYTKVVSAKPVPKAPTRVKAKKVSKTSIRVSWKKVSKANGYKVYRATSQKGKYKAVKTIKKGSTTKYTNKKLKKNRTYYYKVRAYQKVKGKNVYGTYSKVVKARTK